MSHKGRRQLDKRKPNAAQRMAAIEPIVQGEVIPSGFPPNVKDTICMRIMSGESVDIIAQDDDMPCKQTVLKWLNSDPEFKDRYLGCLKIRALGDAAKMQDIADGKTTVKVEKTSVTPEGEEVTTFLELPEDVNRSALRVKTMQWTLSRLLPQVFGDKIQAEHSMTGDLANLIDSVTNAGHNLPGEH